MLWSLLFMVERGQYKTLCSPIDLVERCCSMSNKPCRGSKRCNTLALRGSRAMGMRLGGFFSVTLKGSDNRTSLSAVYCKSRREMGVKKSPSSNRGDTIKYMSYVSTYSTRATLGQSPRQSTITLMIAQRMTGFSCRE